MSKTDAFETIVFNRSDGVATITLNRPEKLNSFNEAMHRDLRAAFDLIDGDSTIRATVITGAGRGFCAGQDLGDRDVGPDAPAPDLGQTLDTLYNPLIRRIRSLPMPVIAGINGVAAGAGCNIAIACDIVIAGSSASFIQAFCKIGLVPDSGGTWTLPRLIGWQRALGLAMLGDKVTAEQAVEWGMIWKMVPDEELQEHVGNLARHFASQPTMGLAQIKHAFNQSATNTLDQQLDLERDLQRQLGKSEDYREGVRAFVEKRKPVFKGR